MHLSDMLRPEYKIILFRWTTGQTTYTQALKELQDIRRASINMDKVAKKFTKRHLEVTIKREGGKGGYAKDSTTIKRR